MILSEYFPIENYSIWSRKIFSSQVVWFLILIKVAHSQPLDLNFQHLNRSNGLSEQNNPYLSQDSKGNTWIGSFDGLNRFNGKEVKVYRPTLPDGTYLPNITSKVLEDKAGKLWFSSNGALHCILPGNDEILAYVLKGSTVAESSSNEHILVHLDKASHLWVIANNWLHCFDPVTGVDSLLLAINSYSCYPISDKHGNIVGLASLMVEQGGGLEIFDFNQSPILRRTFFTDGDTHGISKTLLFFAAVEGDSILWLPSSRGLIRFPLKSPKRAEIFRPSFIQDEISFWDVAPWQDHYLIVTSTTHGFFLFDKRLGKDGFVHHQQSIRLADKILDFKTVHNAFIGKDGTLWLSVWDKGVYYANTKQTKFLTITHPFTNTAGKNAAVLAVIEDKKGEVWSFAGNGNLESKDAKGRASAAFKHWKGQTPGKLFCDSEGDIWAFGSSTVYLKHRDNNNFEMVAKNLRRLNQIVEIDRNEFLLICPNGVFTLIKGAPIKDFSTAEPIINHPSIFNAFLDSSHNLFITDEVDKIWVYSIVNKDIRLIKEISGVGYSNGIVEDHKYRWFASNKGLLKLDLSDYSSVFVKGKNNILQQSFNAILQDDSLNLWLSSNAGIFKYNPVTGEVKHYTESDGLQGLQFMPGSACKLSDGRMAFGGVNGLNIFHPDSVRDNPNWPIVHFTDWVVNDTGSISPNPEYLPKQVFGYNSRTLTFHFVGIDYTAPEEVQYRYFLKDYDQDTVEAGTTSFARYAQLPPGDYVFEVWAANSDGVWTPVPKRIAFAILPPWYLQKWAIALWALILMALLYAFYRFRIDQIKKREAMLRLEAEFKQKEAEIKQQISETETAILRLQMNPHFIFNSMNSISSYILKKDIATANNYLSRFAKLMRMILDLAAKPRITISDEIELLELYMKTEAMRFEQQFTYEFQVDKNIDTDEIMVPTMILQPFVENAIWHGLSRKAGSGHILVGFEKKEGTLVCSVTDNGVGRTPIMVQQNGGHLSRALDITAKRLRLLEEETNVKCFYETIDLKDNNGNPLGTQIVVHIPLMEV